MKTLARTSAALLLACALGAPAFASPSTPASVQRLVKVMEVERTLQGVMVNMDKSILDSARKQGLAPPDLAIAEKYAKRVGDALREEMKVEEFQARMVDIYGRIFSEEEVLGLTAFYESAVGQALLAKTPELVHESSKATQEILGRAMPRVQALIVEMQNEMRERARPEKAD